MKVAIFRAQEDGDRTAALLAPLGHEAVRLPVFAIRPTGHGLPDVVPDAVLFTSRHGVEAVASDPRLPLLLSLPCFCVGVRTADQAKSCGFSAVRVAGGNGNALAAQLLGEFPHPARFLFVAGQHRKPVLEQHLLAANHRVDVVTVYEACAVDEWSPAESGQLRSSGVAAALHYSRRSAELVLSLAAKADLSDVLPVLRHHCIGPDVAIPLQRAGITKIAIASRPDEHALIDTLPLS